MTVADLSNPIGDFPYEAPAASFEVPPQGPTGVQLPGRRPCESFIPAPVSHKKRNAEPRSLDFDATGERREVNALINEISVEGDQWRAPSWNAITSDTRRLLAHWWPSSLVRGQTNRNNTTPN